MVLLWCLTVERYSPGLSAFWATLVMVFITLTHKTLIDLLRKEQTTTHLQEGFLDLIDGMTTGARNMIGIGVATATAGIVVGAVTLTGVGLVMTEFVEWISADSIILMLLIAFTLFRPDFWWDEVYPPYETHEGRNIVAQVEALPDQADARLWVAGETLEGKPVGYSSRWRPGLC